jgi:hypothetical protein
MYIYAHGWQLTNKNSIKDIGDDTHTHPKTGGIVKMASSRRRKKGRGLLVLVAIIIKKIRERMN